MRKPKTVAEVGCNHKGDMKIAKQLIFTAANFCQVDCVKFQKRCNRELLTPDQYNAPHPVSENSYGSTYGEHRETLEFDQSQHAQLKAWCEEAGVVYSTSVWDLTSAKEMTELEPKFLKIPSACNNHYEMLDWLCDNYGGSIHCSTGMTTEEEIQRLVDFFVKKQRAKDVVLYSCTSGYPVSSGEVCLLEISRLKEKYSAMVQSIGFSGHHRGIAIDNAAVALGAEWVERHFTMDRTWKGTDHAASVEPDGMRRLARDLNATWESLRKKNGILDIEQAQRDKLKYKGLS